MKKDLSTALHIDYGVLTDKGLIRSSNEDAYVVDPSHAVFAVSDGMGGHAAGEVASRIAADTLQQCMAGGAADMETLLLEGVRQANAQVYQAQKATPEYRGMGCTLTVLAFQDKRYFVAQVGDSRAYLFRNKILRQLTRDHSLVWPLFEKGVLSKDALVRHPQKNLITRCIGTHPDVEADLYQDAVLQDDLYILCSDGLTDLLTDSAIEQILLDTGNQPQEICRKLVEAANNGGGRDNITVVAVHLP